LAKLNGALGSSNAQPHSTLGSEAPTGGGSIKNKWAVTDSEAMAWLQHDNTTWDDNGKLKGVNWFDFWSEQVHANTKLSQDAYKYCHTDTWSQRRVGNNCGRFWQAYSMTKSDQGFNEGKKMESE
jgi:hypothetical protein